MFKIRPVAIDTYPENMAFLPRTGSSYGAEQFQALKKIEICGPGSSILATLAILDDEHLLEPGEIGLGEQAFRRLGLPAGTMVTIAQARPPASLDAVRCNHFFYFSLFFSLLTLHRVWLSSTAETKKKENLPKHFT